MSEITRENHRTGFEIAVIGMAGRFPGARNINEFWENLKKGVESIWFLSEEELKEMGIESNLVDNPAYVKSLGGQLQDSEYFDADFFGFTPKEAELMDPQLRILHECAWEALEDAGYNPGYYNGLIGVYAGASSNFFWEATSVTSGLADDLGRFMSIQLIDRGFLSTQISYRLNLRGPALTVQTACSTSLVAIHLACLGILSGECEMALAGGVSLGAIPYTGYMYREGAILSPDGHCRTFTEEAKGTMGGEGAGIVLLKPLDEAIAHGDFIYAVIKGSVINNDGSRKVGFSAPSIEGQAEVIKAAMIMAEVEPESISYIETHGTGTELGDPVEIKALKLAFDTPQKKFCGLGSVKTNIGHLDAAAGVASFIKTTLALKHRQIPPTLHFNTPNPKIDFENSPFYVVNQLSEWKNDRYPLRAGISSFGIGGTNAHIVLEESPSGPSSFAGSRGQGAGSEKTYQLILLSANTASALEQMTGNFVNHLKNNPPHHLPDIAYTLQVGRKAFKHRKMLVCSGMEEAVASLASPGSEGVRTFVTTEETSPVAFMFPGQGSQYVNMGWQLYQNEPVFKEEMDRCFEILNALLDYDIKEILYPSSAPSVSSVAKNKEIKQTEIAQPLIFIIEYALARLLIKWGIKPAAMIGHSIGEYTAACLAGVFSLEDALRIVSLRGQLMQQVPSGAMLSISISEEELKPFLSADISLAAVNSPGHCVVSGPHHTVAEFEKQLQEKGYQTRTLHTSHAFHSNMMDSILDPFGKQLSQIELNQPREPFLSNLTGKWISQQQAVDPIYWVKHLRQTVRFNDGINEILKKRIPVFIEVGPGNVLSTLVRQAAENETTRLCVNLLRHPKEDAADDCYLLDKIGQLWLYGAPVDWAGFHEVEPGQRLPLPTYPFERQKYRMAGDPLEMGLQQFQGKVGLKKRTDTADWFYVPAWKQSFLPNTPHHKNMNQYTWLLFLDKCGLGIKLAKQLEQKGAEVIVVTPGPGFMKRGKSGYIINSTDSNDYETLIRQVLEPGKPLKIIHLWLVTRLSPPGIESLWERWQEAQDMGLFSLVFLARAIGQQDMSAEISINVITNNMQKVLGEEQLCPEKATGLGAVKVIAREYPHLDCRSIDILLPESFHEEFLDQLSCELMSGSPARETAYRFNMRWIPTVEPVRLENTCKETAKLVHRGVYLITGGLGGIGLEIAKYLARSVKARLILTGRSTFPERSQWDHWVRSHSGEDDISQKIQVLQEMEALGAEILVLSADAADLQQMQQVITQAETRFGRINGVVHSAGVADYAGVIQRRSKETIETIMAAKVTGTLVLARLLKDANPDFFVLCSSLASLFAPFGEVGYTAANAFLDAFAHYSNTLEKSPGIPTIRTRSINWTSWIETGMAVEAKKRSSGESSVDFSEGVLSAEGVEAFHRIIGTNLPQVAVFTRNLNLVLEKLNAPEYDAAKFDQPDRKKGEAVILKKRPGLSTPYTAPTNKTEETLAHIWQDFFGIESIGIHDDFFELGGDSLRATSLLAKIHKEMNLSISIAAFFNRATIKGITQYKSNTEENGEKGDYLSIGIAEKKEYYDLSPAQKRLFILDQMEPGLLSYNMPEVMSLHGDLNKKDMEKAFKALIHRHESLRTSFEVIETGPVQRIHEEVDFAIEYFEIDKRDDPVGSSVPGDKEGEKKVIEDFIRPFDLSRAPLMRVGLIETSENRCILMADMHHIITDAMSEAILINEFMALYDGEELPDLKLQYKDFSHWHNRRFKSGEIQKQEEYWLKEFAAEVPLLRLPADYPRTATRSFAGSAEGFEWGQDQLKKLKEFAKNQDVTLYVLLLALYNVFLFKVCGQEDIVIGTVAAGRGHADLERIIGMFVNTLALRNYPQQDNPFSKFLKEVKKRTLEAFDNQDYQFDDLVEKLLPNRDSSRNPLFDVMFTYTSQDLYTLPGTKPKPGKTSLNAKTYEFGIKQSKFDLILGVLDLGKRIEFVFQYRTQLFKHSTMEKFVKYFKEILQAVMIDPSIRLKGIMVSHDLKYLSSRVYESTDSEFEF